MTPVRNKIIYLAGPMRGHKRYNYEAFAKAQGELERRGWVVINPHVEDLKAGFNVFELPEDYDWNEYPPNFDAKACRKRCFEAVEKCDCIFMLEGWEDSTGASSEHTHARWCGKGVAYQDWVGYDFCSMEEEEDFLDRLEIEIDPPSPEESEGRQDVPDSAADQIFPDDDQERLAYPVFEGLLDYFPHACAEVAKHSKIGNDQHNPGEPMHWATEKSIGKGNKIVRHLMDGWRTAQAKLRDKTIRHFAAMCWRSLELLERYITRMPPFENK